MFRLFVLFILIISIESRTIFPWNLTTNARNLSDPSIQTTITPYMETSTARKIFNSTSSTTTTTASVTMVNEPFKYQSNFSLNNDSVSLSVHSNATNKLVSINNTFVIKNHAGESCDIFFNESSMDSNSTKTTIFIHFNGTFTRDLAIQLGDRLIDTADLLLEIRSMNYQNQTTDIV